MMELIVEPGDVEAKAYDMHGSLLNSVYIAHLWDGEKVVLDCNGHEIVIKARKGDKDGV